MQITSSHHQYLQPFVGRFRGKVSLWVGGPDPIISTGVLENQLQIDDLYLHQSYEGDPFPGSDRPFVGKGYWGYNPHLAQFEGFWIDNVSGMMQLDRGTVDDSGTRWTMESTFIHPKTKSSMKKQVLIHLVHADQNTMTTYFEQADGSRFRAMEIEYNRIS